jgi:hypothetical protein
VALRVPRHQFGQVIDIFVSAQRNGRTARRFFERAIGTTKITPVEVITDHAPVYPAVLEELLPAAWHRTDRYANNHIECDHGRLKARLRPMGGLKQDRSARVVIAGHGFVQNLRRGHHPARGRGADGPALGGRVRRACLGDLTPDRVATSPCRELIRCNSADGGSTPPAPTTPNLTRALAGFRSSRSPALLLNRRDRWAAQRWKGALPFSRCSAWPMAITRGVVRDCQGA